MEVKELEIEAPWGQIAVRCIGDPKNPHILCFHGILDNLGSFTRLLKLLPNSFYYVCVDLPGHGLSTEFPPNLPLYNIDNLLVYIIVTNYFAKERYILMGHSYGGQLAMIYTMLYPEKVEKIILLDTIYTLPIHPNYMPSYLRERLERFMSIDKKVKSNKPPEYTYEEALDKVQTSRDYGDINPEAAVALLERGMRLNPNGRYTFTFDQRLKAFLVPLSDIRYILDIIKRNFPQCPILVVLGDQSKAQQMYMKKILDDYKKRRNVKVVNVQGAHDVHNVEPELVAPHVSKFLLNLRTKL